MKKIDDYKKSEKCIIKSSKGMKWLIPHDKLRMSKNDRNLQIAMLSCRRNRTMRNDSFCTTLMQSPSYLSTWDPEFRGSSFHRDRIIWMNRFIITWLRPNNWLGWIYIESPRNQLQYVMHPFLQLILLEVNMLAVHSLSIEENTKEISLPDSTPFPH